jgi:hypothetical protein
MGRYSRSQGDKLAWRRRLGNRQLCPSFESWLQIGKALLIGLQRGLFSLIKVHHFDNVRAPTRSIAIELPEHPDQITAWHDGLPQYQCKRLVHPLSVTRRWLHNGGKTPAVIYPFDLNLAPPDTLTYHVCRAAEFTKPTMSGPWERPT